MPAAAQVAYMSADRDDGCGRWAAKRRSLRALSTTEMLEIAITALAIDRVEQSNRS